MFNLKNFIMEKSAIIMLGSKKSDSKSPFAVFENFGNWSYLKNNKIIPEGMYFAVVVPENNKKVDIFPDLFIQGYRPHSSVAKMSVSKRRYGRFVEGLAEFDDDMPIVSSQLYRAVGEREVELVLKVGECRQLPKIGLLACKICGEFNLERMGALKMVKYSCSASSGYFLKGRDYKVWAVVVGERKDFSLVKKALVFDFITGIPGIVEYKEEDFETV